MTMLPPSRTWGSAACSAKKAPLRLTPCTLSQNSSVTSGTAAKPPIPAFTNSTSMPPSCSAMRASAARLSATELMSERTASMPLAAATCASVASLRPVIATRAPSAWNALAAARPMPLLPPSTTTLWPAKRMGSEHPVGIGRLFRHWLGHVPVLCDLAVLDAQDVDHRKSAIARCELGMRVHGNEIAVRDDALDRIDRIRMVAEEGLEEGDRRVATRRRERIVLNVARLHPGLECRAHLLLDVELIDESGDNLLGLQAALGRMGKPGGQAQRRCQQDDGRAHASLPGTIAVCRRQIQISRTRRKTSMALASGLAQGTPTRRPPRRLIWRPAATGQPSPAATRARRRRRTARRLMSAGEST